MGTRPQQIEMSMDHPYFDPHPLISRLLNDPKWKQAYHEHVREIIEDAYSPTRLAKVVRSIETKVLPKADEAARAAGKIGSPQTRPTVLWGAQGNLASFVDARVHAVVNQLQGASTGYIPQRMRPQPPVTRPATRPVTRPVILVRSSTTQPGKPTTRAMNERGQQ
jgi:hypothetical protein